MRARTPLLAALALLACSGDPAARPAGEEPDVPRGPWELLVQRVSRAGERSFYTMAPDGAAVLAFDGIPDDVLLAVPAPDGRTLALLRAAGLDVHLWLQDRDGANRRPLLEGTRVVHHVAWSPDGARLAYAASTLEDFEDLWVANADGTGARNLTPDPKPGVWADRAPAWSPDGTRIAFSSNRSGISRLWLMGADGTGPVQVLPAALEATEREPAWSPDGALIAFTSDDDTGRAIGVVRPDGGGYRRFPVAGDAGRPAWTAGGELLYVTDATGDLDVYRLDRSSGVSTNLTSHRDHDQRALPLRHVAPAAWRRFGAPVRHAAGAPGATAVAAADVVADGLPDLALLAPAAAEVRLLLGTGDGFDPLGALETPAGPRALAAADVSRDGHADLVVLGPQELAVFRGGPGGPGPAEGYPLPGDGRGLAVADLDSDGARDVVVVHAGDGTAFHVRVLSPQGDGSLLAILDGATPFGAAAGACAADVTGEGTVDLVVATTDPAAPVVLLPGHGDGSFAAPVAAPAGLAPGAAPGPVCAELGGDRRAELLLLRPGDPAGPLLYRSTGAGFGAAAPLGLPAAAAAAADVDRDGDVDLLLADPSRPDVTFLRNLGDGRFARPAGVAVGGAPVRLVVADLEGDLWPDLTVADLDGSAAVLWNLGR